MKGRRILSGILTICLILSSISIPVLGAEEDSKGLEKAINTAKSIITVPEDYTEFTNNLSEQETVGGKVKVWRLNWSKTEDKTGQVSASVGEDGFLYDYNKYDDNDKVVGLAKIAKDQAQAAAEKFIAKVAPAYSGKIKKVDLNDNVSSDQVYYFTYQNFENEVPVNFINIEIGVDKYSGEVTTFQGKNPEIKGVEYPSVQGILGEDVAEKTYLEKLGVNLKYHSSYDYKQKKINVFAGYSIDNQDKSIDAKTGEVLPVYEDGDILYSKGGASDKVEAKNVSEGLTTEETDEVNNVADLISKEKAESILRENLDIIPADMKVNSTSLTKNKIDDKYVWRVSFDSASGSVDAKSGEIISMHFYNDDNSKNSNLSKADAQKLVETFLNKTAPDKFAQTKYKEENEIVLKDRIAQEEKDFSFNYVRQVNGIEFSNNSLRVEVNKNNGKIIGYDNTWYENISFPDVSRAMSKEAAFNKIKDLAGFGLQYNMVDKNKIGLVYNFKNLNDNYIIDPISGIRLDFSGQAYKDNKLPEYTDIKGQGCEKIVKELLDNGYYIDGDKFNPNMNITQVNFFKYLYSPVKDSYNTDDEFYDMLIQNKVLIKEEKALNALVSNQDAAKFIIRYLGYDKIAAHPEIFVNPFKDNIEDKYKGYASMCYGLNIIKGVNGNFNGTHNITNAEAAVIIYNSISVNK